MPDLETEGMQLTCDNGWQPSKYRVIYVCPICDDWQVDMTHSFSVQFPSLVNDVLKDHLLECA